MQDPIDVRTSKVEVFNQKNPVGSTVTVIFDGGKKAETKVKFPAQVLNGGMAVVWLEGISGCYALNRVI